MTILDRFPDAAVGEPVAELLPSLELDEISAHLPQQEWCDACALDEDSEPGMPQVVAGRAIERLTLSPRDWNRDWGAGPLYSVTYLSCGHTIAGPA